MILRAKQPFLAIVIGALALSLGPSLAFSQAAAPQKPQTADAVFKNIQIFKGVPVDEFMDTMGFFSASTSLNCTGCHGLNSASGDWARYADETPMKLTARKMILMVNAINKNNFGGVTMVTCYTCHRGDTNPTVIPSLLEQYSEPPPDDPNTVAIRAQAPGAPSADQVFAKYTDALGGAKRLAALSSFTAKGTYNGFDTEFEDQLIEIFAKAPASRKTIIHFRVGDSTTAFNGNAGWIAEPDKPVPLIELTGGDLDGAKVDATVFFPSGLKQVRKNWVVGSTTLDDKSVQVVEGSTAAQLPVKLYFDKSSGLLLREVRYTRLPVGQLVTQIDYTDYRDVFGVKVPFRWRTTWGDGRSTTTITSMQANVPIDESNFEKPSAGSAPSSTAR